MEKTVILVEEILKDNYRGHSSSSKERYQMISQVEKMLIFNLQQMKARIIMFTYILQCTYLKKLWHCFSLFE